MDKLTDKQKKFCEYYLKLGNGTQAAIKAGYSAKSANRMASENLTKPYISEYVEKRRAEMDAKLIATTDEVLKFFTRVMRGEEKDQFGLDTSNQDKIKAAELLGKRYRLFTDKVEIEANKGINITVKKASEDNGD